MVLQFPSIFLLPDQISDEEVTDLKAAVGTCTDNIDDATVIVGRLSRRERALFELRRRRVLFTTDISNPLRQNAHDSHAASNKASSSAERQHDTNTPQKVSFDNLPIVKIDWLVQSLKQGRVLELNTYLICEVWKISSETQATYARQTKASSPQAVQADSDKALSESRLTEFSLVSSIATQGYSCQRVTPKTPVNASFVKHLKEIRTLRKVKGDHVGTRAYSTAIAAIAAHTLSLRTRMGKCFTYTV